MVIFCCAVILWSSLNNGVCLFAPVPATCSLLFLLLLEIIEKRSDRVFPKFKICLQSCNSRSNRTRNPQSAAVHSPGPHESYASKGFQVQNRLRLQLMAFFDLPGILGLKSRVQNQRFLSLIWPLIQSFVSEQNQILLNYVLSENQETPQ